MAPTEFTFVHHTGDDVSHPQSEDLPTIRSHAMREVRRRRQQRQEQCTPLVSETAAESIGQLRLPKTADAIHRFHPSINASQSRKTVFPRSFSNAYAGTAIGLEEFPADAAQRIDYFVHGLTPSTFPTSHVHHECDLLRVAMSEGNLALLHALCAVSAAHQASETPTLDGRFLTRLVNPGRTTEPVLFHKQHVFMWLRMNLTRYAERQMKSILATIALLLMIESLSGEATTAKTHKLGLLALVKGDGAPRKSSDFLGSEVLMADIKSATLSLSQPSTSPCGEWLASFERLKHLPFVPCRPDLVLLGSGFGPTNVGHHLDPAFVPLMKAMRNLINAVEHSFDIRPSVPDVNGAHFLVLEHQLLSFRPDITVIPATKDRFRPQLTECCRIGALLYCNLCLWTWPKKASLVENLLRHLRATISQCIQEPDVYEEEQCSVSLLWLYFMGSFATSSMEEFQWYLKGMQNVLALLKVDEETHFRSILAKQFYVERLMGLHAKVCYIRMFTGTDS